MDYIDPDVRCPEKAIKLITHSPLVEMWKWPVYNQVNSTCSFLSHAVCRYCRGCKRRLRRNPTRELSWRQLFVNGGTKACYDNLWCHQWRKSELRFCFRYTYQVHHIVFSFSHCTTLIARFMGPTWGPSGSDRTQVGPMLAPWTLLSG